MSIRVLTHAIEGYLLGCAGPSTLTGATVIRMPFDVDELMARLLQEEDMLIKKYGPPWAA